MKLVFGEVLIVVGMSLLAIAVAIFLFNVTHGGIGEMCNRDGTCITGLHCVHIPEMGYRCVSKGQP